MKGSGQTANGWIFDPVAKKWTVSAATTGDRHYGSAVLLPLLPPSYTPKVINFGGGGNPAMSTTEIIDLSAVTPNWTPGPDMSAGRIQMNAIILPNGTVLAEGGSVNNESPNPASRHADLYDPVSNSFSSGGTASYSRLYHSVALLLPDATVMSMGRNPGPRGNYEPAIEIYTPGYLFDSSDQLIPAADRPNITGITPGVIGYNAAFSVTYTSTSANELAASGPPKGGVTLRWTQSATPGVTQNYIYRRTSTGSYSSTPTVKINAATSYVDNKLSSGSNYCYRVTAVSSGGESPPSSSEACAKAK